MKYPQYTARETELEILNHWKILRVTENIRKRNQDGPTFYFLEGPPYTSGRIHLGTAWNMCLKDIILRYKRMNGFNVFYRMGYDMHGLPTEQKVMSKLNLKNKDDIVSFGLDKFMHECYLFCTEMMQKMNEDFQRLGSTLDYTNPYQPISKEFMQAEWWLIQQAHNKGRLYPGLRTMHWDAGTQTAVAKHELEYKSVKDTAIYVKFAVEKKQNTYFLIWTTTPWTIPLNLAVMANPKLTYVHLEVQTETGTETWICGKELVKNIVAKSKITQYKIKKEYPGKKLEGIKYSHPLNVREYFPKDLQTNKKLYTVLMTEEFVESLTGTGLVHCAPGCGPEDYEVGHQNHIPPFNCVNEEGFFEKFGPFTNFKAKIDDLKFIIAIKESGALLAKESYVHDYPHGERSHEPIIFRTTKQWFFKVEDLKDKLVEANKNIFWNPETAKNGFQSWLENLRDNSITKQRYWGTPVPIWECKETGEYIVVGSIPELEKLSGQKVEEMHIPYIDKITITKDGKLYQRIPDVLDVWIDAGTVSWNALDYPTNQELFKKWFPADFILEGKDQIRGWFNLLMIASFLAFDAPSFKNVYMNGFVTDVGGQKMSKSLGNIISPDELTEKYGADSLRYYMCQTNAGADINFSFDECATKSRYLSILWNIHKLLITTIEENKINPFKLDKNIIYNLLGEQEGYILSKLHSTIEEVTGYLEHYKIDEIIAPIENLYLELSRTYIQIVRDKLVSGDDQEKEVCLYTIFHVLLETLKMFHVVTPFITDAIFLNLKETCKLEHNSLSEYCWPKPDKTRINKTLENDFETAKTIIQASLGAREKAQLGVRWPIKEVIVITKNPEISKAAKRLQNIIKQQTNAKKLSIQEKLPGIKYKIKPDYGKIGPIYGEMSTQIITKLTIDSPETILTHLENEGKYEFKSEGKNIEITKEMIKTEREVPPGFQEGSAKWCLVYIATERTTELEAEGYCREIGRNIQDQRKKMNLQKPDRIILFLKVSAELKAMLLNFKEDLEEKVGATKLEILTNDPARKHEISGEFKIKNEKIVSWIDRV